MNPSFVFFVFVYYVMHLSRTCGKSLFSVWLVYATLLIGQKKLLIVVLGMYIGADASA